jgi:hypothetical protein
MSESIKSNSTESLLKPIEDILSSNKSNIITYSTEIIPNDDYMSSISFKIIIILIGLLIGIIAKIYLGKEINEFIEKIKNYFETIKYHKKEEKELEKQEEENKKQEEENKKNEPKTKEEIMKESQETINYNKKEYKKENKKENKKNQNQNQQNQQPTGIQTSSLHGTTIEKDFEEYQKDSLQKALDDASKTIQNVSPDLSSSSIQSNSKGWCLIGADDGARTCSEIGPRDVCMSGEIYPTREVCINPRLRA